MQPFLVIQLLLLLLQLLQLQLLLLLLQLLPTLLLTGVIQGRLGSSYSFLPNCFQQIVLQTMPQNVDFQIMGSVLHVFHQMPRCCLCLSLCFKLGSLCVTQCFHCVG